MDKALIVSSTDNGIKLLSELLAPLNFEQVIKAQNGGEARRLLADGDFDFIMINAPLTDEFGHELAASFCAASDAAAMLFVKTEFADEIAHRLEKDGVFVLPKPVSRTLFYQAVQFAGAAHSRLLRLRRESVRLQTKLEELRTVGRAKCILMEYDGMSEAEAHRYIEKRAMDTRSTRRVIAEGILKSYEY